jgi:hypothetical protein
MAAAAIPEPLSSWCGVDRVRVQVDGEGKNQIMQGESD